MSSFINIFILETLSCLCFAATNCRRLTATLMVKNKAQRSRGQSQARMTKKEEEAEVEAGEGAAPATWISSLPPGQETSKCSFRGKMIASESNKGSKSKKIRLKLGFCPNKGGGSDPNFFRIDQNLIYLG